MGSWSPWHMLLPQLPLWLVYFAGFAWSLQRLKQAPMVGFWALLGCGVLFISSLLGPLLYLLVQQLGGFSGAALWLPGVIGACLHAVGVAMLLWAVWLGRDAHDATA